MALVRYCDRVRVPSCRIPYALLHACGFDRLFGAGYGFSQPVLDALGTDFWQAAYRHHFNGHVLGWYYLECRCEGLQQFICLASLC